MEKKDTLITVSIILAIIAVAVMGFSYAYFSLDINGTGSLIEGASSTLELTYDDTNAITLNTAYPGDHSNKTFKIENTGTKEAYYALTWDIIRNTYLYDELVYHYTCTSYKYYDTASQIEYGTCDSKLATAVPTSDGVIDNSVHIAKDITHVYSFEVLFLEMSSLQNYNLDASFSGIIVPYASNIDGEIDYGNVSHVSGNPTSAPWYELCDADSVDIKCKIISGTTTSTMPYADNVASTYVSSATGIDYGAISSATNGRGLYYTTRTDRTEDIDDDGDGERVYFYRGGVTNNYLIFGGFCWRIIRTVEDGSVRLRYGGAPSNGSCPQTGTNVNIGSSKYANGNSDNAYLGYMMGTLNADSYVNTHTNSSNSPIKTVVDTWFGNNLTSYLPYIANTVYCNDRKLGTDGTVAGLTFAQATAYGAHNAIYAVTRRLATGGETGDIAAYTPVNASPSYICEQQNDQFTLDTTNGGIDGYGNNKLIYPIALLTADEVSYAGGAHSIASTDSWFLSMGSNGYWTMSPFRQGVGGSQVSRNVLINSSAMMNVAQPNSANGVVPVISLKSEVTISSGTGLYNDPYIVSTN